ncbi:hypothetical protein K469DRAFT_699308 [Zopfia rhizophila CBS 207.26]|uniref:Uncharacterized protein n=1 Tax=Zopfia rhizophila CBS 207.26 TaxID=1314779 RepID=A0A6A6F0R4_9PEZI|nr:hypothetical protein K469DRAFT_699308 [Zopfia rhizophila CBS 207.26]
MSELKRAVNSHHKLRDQGPYINYSLRIVGTTPDLASPSIVIECKTCDIKPLKALFKEKAKDKLYCGKSSRIFQLFRKNTPPKPASNLVYFRSDKDALNRRAAR